MKRNAVALRAFSHAEVPIEKDQVILDMSPNQFTDWEQAALIRAATTEEAAAARGIAPATSRSTSLPAGQKTPRKRLTTQEK